MCGVTVSGRARAPATASDGTSTLGSAPAPGEGARARAQVRASPSGRRRPSSRSVLPAHDHAAAAILAKCRGNFFDRGPNVAVAIRTTRAAIFISFRHAGNTPSLFWSRRLHQHLPMTPTTPTQPGPAVLNRVVLATLKADADHVSGAAFRGHAGPEQPFLHTL
jgi:hypothetical protein